MAGIILESKAVSAVAFIAKLVVLVVALALNATFLFIVLNPKVRPEYRDYFIEKTAKRWVRGGQYPEVRPYEKIFSDKGPKDPSILGMGWSEPDASGVWSEEPQANLLFRVTFEIKADCQVVVSGTPFQRPGRDFQVADIIVNGQNLQTVRFSGDVDQEYKIIVPFSLVEKRNGYVSLQFRFADLKSPRDLSLGTDLRKLGFHMTALRLDPL
ncbi:hypothetical protein AB4072_01235 [Microvirga sp. 2MCAF38]|uniref:hypothetical protein n=1 Tax=Microvirga sp. 2MCAF38 TaxID=3232989 RepID=UPI003F9829D7